MQNSRAWRRFGEEGAQKKLGGGAPRAEEIGSGGRHTETSRENSILGLAAAMANKNRDKLGLGTC